MEIMNSSKRCGKLYSSLINLIEIVQETQLEREKTLFSLSKKQIAKEFGTIKLYTARGSGHTSAIAKLIEEKLNKVVLVFPTINMASVFEKRFPNIKDKIYFCSPKSFNRLLGLRDYEAIITDCSCLISQSKIDELYDLTSGVMDKPLYLFME